MIVSIFALLVLFYLAKYISSRILEIKTDNKKENEINFWIFSYDFKKEKKESIFDRDTNELIYKKRKKNNLIVLLYITHIAIFIYANYFLSQILFIILK